MIVGIGFVATLTAAIAERFVAVQVGEQVEHAEDAVAATEADLLDELRAIRRRLESVETKLTRQSLQ